MLFKKKKEVEKPSRSKIERVLTKSKDAVESLLTSYDNNVDLYIDKIVTCKKGKRYQEANRYISKLKQLMCRREKMQQLYDQVESFEMLINEAFAKIQVYESLNEAIGEVNKISMAPELNNIVKNLKDFEKTFGNNITRFDQVFTNITNAMNAIDLDASNEYDSEIQAIVKDKIQELENTKFNVEENDSIDDLMNSL